MWNEIKSVFLKGVGSLKVWTMLLGLLVFFGAKYGFEVDADTYWVIAGAFSLLLTGQMVKGAGAVAAQVTANAKTLPTIDNVVVSEDIAYVHTVMPVDNGYLIVMNDGTYSRIPMTGLKPVEAQLPLDLLLKVNSGDPGAKNPEGGFARLSVMLTIVMWGVLCAMLASSVSCTWFKKQGTTLANNIVDCTTANAKTITQEFGPLMKVAFANATGEDGKVDWNSIKSSTSSFGKATGSCVLVNTIASLLNPKMDPNAPQSEGIVYDKASMMVGFEELRMLQLGGATFKTPEGTL